MLFRYHSRIALFFAFANQKLFRDWRLTDGAYCEPDASRGR